MDPSDDERDETSPVPEQEEADAAESRMEKAASDNHAETASAAESELPDVDSNQPEGEESDSTDVDGVDELELTDAFTPANTAASAPRDMSVTPAVPPASTGQGSATPADSSDPHTYLLPIGNDGDKSATKANPTDELFPRDWRLPANSSHSNNGGQSAAAIRNVRDGGHTVPQFQILVGLAEGRTAHAAAIEEALEKFSLEFREIAEYEVDRGFRNYQIEQSFFDW